MRQAKSYKKRRTGRTYFPPEPEDKSNIEKMCVLCKYHPSNIQTEMPSEEDIANAIAMSCERMVQVSWDAKKIAARDILKLFKQYLTKD